MNDKVENIDHRAPATGQRTRPRSWRRWARALLLSHAQQIVSAVVVGVAATLISTSVLTQIGLDEDVRANAVESLSAQREAVEETFAVRAKLAQVGVLLTLLRVEIAEEYQTSGRLPPHQENLDISRFDLNEHPLIEDSRLTDDGKLHVRLSADFGPDKYLTVWPEASTKGVYLLWRCKTNVDEANLGPASMQPCYPVD